jgi:hypothetical protein
MRLRVGLAIIAASISASAQTTTAIIVQVQGTGVVRVHVMSGDATLFNDHMQAGQTMTLASPTPCVVVEHTYGSFREVNWSPTRVFCPRHWRNGPHESFTRVDVSTDAQ